MKCPGARISARWRTRRRRPEPEPHGKRLIAAGERELGGSNTIDPSASENPDVPIGTERVPDVVGTDTAGAPRSTFHVPLPCRVYRVSPIHAVENVDPFSTTWLSNELGAANAYVASTVVPRPEVRLSSS